MGIKHLNLKKRPLIESLWLAKKARFESEKDIDLLINRIELLKREEELSKKKIEDTKLKTK